MSEYITDHIKAVFFDHDDTLVGTINAKWQQHKHVARTVYNKEVTDEELARHWGKPLAELVCVLYGTNDPQEAMANMLAVHKDFPKELFAATVPTLRRIKETGRLIGIVTATGRVSFEHDLELHQVPYELLDYTQTMEDTPYHKPDSRVFEPAIAWLQERAVVPQEVLYVGDGLRDMKAAQGAGFNFLGVQTGLVTAEQFMAHQVPSIPSIDHLFPGQ